MSAAFYTKIAQTTQKLLQQYGSSATLIHIAQTQYNPQTGQNTQSTQKHTAVAARFEYQQHEIDGTRIRQNDCKIYISNINTTPQIDDIITFGNAQYSIINTQIIAPSQQNVLFICQCRHSKPP